MQLFGQLSDDDDLGYRNLFLAEHITEQQIRDELERLWQRYQPYADSNFPLLFSRNPEPRFWEMYLTVQFVDAGYKVLPRSSLNAANRDIGPDICILDNDRAIWVEAVTPELGEATNSDQVPEIVPLNEGGQASYAPRRQVELRITSALSQKRNAFERYREMEIVGEHDLCIVAISGANFWAQSATVSWPTAVTAVYPIGDYYFSFDKSSLETTDSGFTVSEEIKRTNKDGIPRTAFMHEHFSRISGLIWSRITMGNFSNRNHDFCYVPNHIANVSLPKFWFPWAEEFVAIDEEGTVNLTRTFPNEKKSY